MGKPGSKRDAMLVELEHLMLSVTARILPGE